MACFHASKLTEQINSESKMYIIDHSEETDQNTFMKIKPISTFVSSQQSPCPEPETEWPKNPIQQTSQKKAKAIEQFKDFDTEQKDEKVAKTTKNKQYKAVLQNLKPKNGRIEVLGQSVLDIKKNKQHEEILRTSRNRLESDDSTLRSLQKHLSLPKLTEQSNTLQENLDKLKQRLVKKYGRYGNSIKKARSVEKLKMASNGGESPPRPSQRQLRNGRLQTSPANGKCASEIISNSVERLYRSTESNVMANFRVAPYSTNKFRLSNGRKQNMNNTQEILIRDDSASSCRAQPRRSINLKSRYQLVFGHKKQNQSIDCLSTGRIKYSKSLVPKSTDIIKIQSHTPANDAKNIQDDQVLNPEDVDVGTNSENLNEDDFDNTQKLPCSSAYYQSTCKPSVVEPNTPSQQHVFESSNLKSENQIKKMFHTSDFKNSRNKIYATELKPSTDRPSLIDSEKDSAKNAVKGFKGNGIESEAVLIPCQYIQLMPRPIEQRLSIQR